MRDIEQRSIHVSPPFHPHWGRLSEIRASAHNISRMRESGAELLFLAGACWDDAFVHGEGLEHFVMASVLHLREACLTPPGAYTTPLDP